MPASFPLQALGLLSASTIVAVSALYGTVPPPSDSYRATIRLAAGLLLAAGSLLLAWQVGRTFLRQRGNFAFKALFWAACTSVGAGISEAFSAFYAANFPLALTLCVASFSIAGLGLLRFQKGGI